MRISLAACLSALLLVVLAGCSETESDRIAHPNVVIVRDFAAPLGVVTLDPSFGFSLNRGESGVPPRQRGGAVARAASFALTDSIADRLRALGFDVLRSQTEQPEPDARALIVTGAFRKINEGYRREVGAENSSVAVDARVDYSAPASQSQPLLSLHLDSAELRGEAGATTAAARGGPAVNAGARQIGAEIASRIAEVARRNNWPIAAR
jgi:N-acetylmuramoyl-L-alanine amidase